MKPCFSSIGRRFGSVALRYRHPISAECVGKGYSDGGYNLRKWHFSAPHHHDGGEISAENQLSRLEAILFLSRQPLTSRKLAQLADLADGTRARTLTRKLNLKYDADERAFHIEEVAGGFQLMTRPKYAPWLRRLYSTSVEIRLSPSVMETLAIVAYRQPVLRVEIEAIRGVQSGEVLRQLIERDFVRIAGRSEELGRPYLYGTTRQFLQIFGLRHLDELPRAEILRNHEPISVGQDSPIESDPSISNRSNQSQAAEEEDDKVKTLIAPKRRTGDEKSNSAVLETNCDERLENQSFIDAMVEEDDDFEDDDFDDDLEDEEDEDLEDEPWEEVEDDDEDEDDEEWEEDDEDLDDDDEEWDDEEWEEDDDEWEEDDEEEEEDDD